MEEPIQNLLSTMGWSCDDLLAKLQHFKNLTKTSTTPKEFEHSNHENTDNDSSQTSNNTSSETTKENVEDMPKPKENDGVSEIDLPNTEVPASLQNGVKTIAENLEINSESAIIENNCTDTEKQEDVMKNAGNDVVSIIDDDEESFTLELEDDTFESENDSDKNIREEVDVIISLMEDDDSETFQNENDSFDSDIEGNLKQGVKESEVTINFSLEGFESEQDSYLSYLKEVAEAGERSKNQAGNVISLTEDDDTATSDDKTEAAKSENENVKELETNQSAKEVATISLMKDDDAEKLETKTEAAKSENEVDIKELESNQKDSETSTSEHDSSIKEVAEITKNEESATNSIMEVDATIGNQTAETSKLENEMQVEELGTDQSSKEEVVVNEEENNSTIKVSKETDQNTTEKEVRIVSLMEVDDIAAVEDKTETSKSEKEMQIEELDTDQSQKEKEVENATLMEIDSSTKDLKETDQNITSLVDDYGIVTFANETESSNLDNKTDVKELETDENGKDASISLMEQDDTATKSDEMEVNQLQKRTETENDINSSIEDDKNETTETSAEESNDVFIKPTATVKEFTEAKKSETLHEEDSEFEPKHNEEELRNMLRMQILQLRNKKTADVIPAPLDKDLLTRKVPESKKKKRKLSTDDEKEEPTPTKKVAVEEDVNKKGDLDSVLLSNESEFLIVDVIGGYKSPEPEEPPKIATTRIINEHLEGEPLRLTKTTNYKDIKGWQRKKFIVPIDEDKPPKPVPFFDEAVPSCSFEQPVVAPPQKPIKSAFESNLLDKFLVEHSQLNISYEVPKLHAEGSITHDDLLVPVKSFDVNFDRLEEDRRPMERYKPKTLAEKRKMLERVGRRKEKEKAHEEVVKPDKEKPTGVYISRMYCKGKVIKVRTRVPYGGYVYYMTKQGLSKSSRRAAKKPGYVMEEPEKIEKPSLLTCLRTPETEKVYYKPGPLSMKRKLQNQDTTSEWTTVIKKLPTITLEVFPEFCKPVDPKVLCYLDYNKNVLTEERVDFALTALKCEEKQRKGFVFPVKYKNDEQFMMFRQERPRVTVPPPEKEDDETAVQTVIDKLLNYVEISEIADDLIKPDPEERISEKPDTVKPLPPINNRIDAIIKSSRKRRTSLELRRLNVKIIDVDVAEKEDTEKVCLKPFCRMGCICKSLECGKSYNFHCGNQECMLDCKCNYSRLKHTERVVLPAGTDILSYGTVNHLQKQAKKNLAKVEKEFVQTVIQSNDKTIILSTGCRDRQRRATKLPRKMSDYVPLQNIDDDGEKKVLEAAKTTYKKEFRPCVVKIERLDLSDLIPLCLVHKLYDCHCGFQTPYPATDPTPETTPEHSPEPSKPNPKRFKPIEIITIQPESAKPPRPTTPEQCARTKRVPTRKYRLRNSSSGYLERLRRLLAQKERLFPPTGPRIYVPPISPPPPPPPPQPPQVHKRKQTLELRDERRLSDSGVEVISVRKDLAIQRRKKKISIGSGAGGLVDNSYEETRSLMEELGKYLEKESQDKVHLMPWELLITGYKDGSLQVWCNLKAKKVLITTTNVRPNKTYMNVNFLQHCICNKEEISIEIIRCLMTYKVPKDKNPNEILIVLTFNDSNKKKPYYEVRGICEKDSAHSGSSVSIIKSDLTNDVSTSAETFAHITMDNNVKMMPYIKRVFIDRLLTYHRNNTTSENSQPVIQVPLPQINSNERWCMMSIVRKYSYIRFTDINYTIRREDITNLANIARKLQHTLILEARHFNQRNPAFQKNIYVVPTHKDRIFVGPYTNSETAKIETLDYLQRSSQVLVNTDLYCKIKGELPTCCKWLRQIYNCDIVASKIDEMASQKRSLLKQNAETIKMPDLVVIDDDDDDDKNVEQASVEKTAQETAANDDDDVVLVKDKEYIPQCNIKRYFVTNVKALGYIVGTQLSQSKIIDVFSPTTNSMVRHSKPEAAVETLERQLNNSLIRIPSDFKIKVTMVDEPDSTMVPFQSKYVVGQYAVGEFGICDLEKTPESKYPFPGGMTVELAKQMKEHASNAILIECRKLVTFFSPSTKVHQQSYKSITEIIEGAKTEIKHQNDMFDKLNKSKIALELKRLELVNRLKELDVEPNKNKPETVPTTPVPVKEEVLIEISDDEDDKKPKESTPKIQIEKMPKLLAPTKLVPPLIKITKTSAKDGNKLILSPLKAPTPVLKTQRSLVKVPVQGILRKTSITPGQKYVLVRDSTDPEIIKRLKINSGLQVSVADKDSPAQQKEATPPVGSSMQVQTCEIVTVKENNGVKCVSLKRRIPVTELQSMMKKQLSAAAATKSASASKL